MQLVAMFDLDTGALEGVTHSPLSAHEGGLFETELMPALDPGDLLVGDRALWQLSARGRFAGPGGRLAHAFAW